MSEPEGGWSGPRAPFVAAGETAEGRTDGAEGIAAFGVLRRIRWLAVGWGLVGGMAMGWAHSPRRGLVLTGGAVVSIVALRSLEGVVRRLRAPGPEGSGEAAAPASLGLAYPFRLLLLIALVILLAVGGRDPLALIFGLSAVPLAVLAEAALQVVVGGKSEIGEGSTGPRQGHDGSES